MNFSITPKQVKAQMTSHDKRLVKGESYLVIYTREITYRDGTTHVVVALAEDNKEIQEYPIRWFSLDHKVPTSEQE